MKKILFYLIFASASISAQEFGPPPPACDSYFALDADGDGITQFDIALFTDSYIRPKHLQFYGIDLSGYTLNLYASEIAFFDGDPPISGIYTNTEPNQFCYLDFVYNGSGPEYPAGSPEWFQLEHCFQLQAIASDDDFDADGVINSIEDLNGNSWLGDDDTDLDTIQNWFDNDDDNDGTLTVNEDYNNNSNWLDDDVNANGIADYLDPAVTTLKLAEFTSGAFVISPNPASNEIRIVNSMTLQNESARIFNMTGKLIMEINDLSKSIDVSQLDKGIYLISISSEGKAQVGKLIIQ